MSYEERLVDRDGDEWVVREDGLCCQRECVEHGRVHTCDEHDHMPRAGVERTWGPLVAASPLSEEKGASGE